MSKAPDNENERRGERIDPRLALAITLAGILLLMGFSIAIHQWGSNPVLSLAAGATAVTLISLVVRRLLPEFATARREPRKSLPAAESAGTATHQLSDVRGELAGARAEPAKTDGDGE